MQWGDANTREGAVWVAYRAALIARHGGSVLAAMVADSNNSRQTLTIVFSNCSIGEYTRSDSGFRDSHGFWETKSPSCG